MELSRQEYWSGLSCPPPGNLSDPGVKPGCLESPASAGRFFTASATWEAQLPPVTSQIPSFVQQSEWTKSHCTQVFKKSTFTLKKWAIVYLLHKFLKIQLYLLEKAMAPHSSPLAWKIPWTEEPGRLQSMGSRRVGHDWGTSLSLFTFRHWRRKWQPTPVFLPGESQGRRSLVGCRLWGRTGSDTTEATQQQQQLYLQTYLPLLHPCL